MTKKLIPALLLASFCVITTGCPGTTSSTPSSSTTGGGTGGGGSTSPTPFTAADIVKTWTSACTASLDSVVGSTYYKNVLELNSNGTFMFQQYLYTNPNPSSVGTCSNVNYYVVFTIYGTYSVASSFVSGSTSLQDITFTVDVSSTVPSLMVDGGTYVPALATTQDAFNNDCGGTSPYCTLSNGTCTNNNTASGHGVNSQHMNCQHYTFPNTGNNTIYNVGTYDSSSSTLTLGAGNSGVPGVFSSGSTPTSATITYQ